jgi:hypothetical protein
VAAMACCACGSGATESSAVTPSGAFAWAPARRTGFEAVPALPFGFAREGTSSSRPCADRHRASAETHAQKFSPGGRYKAPGQRCCRSR